MKTFDLHVLSPERPYYEGSCVSLTVSTTEGEYGVLANHSNSIAGIVPGTLKICLPDSTVMIAATSAGLLKIENNKVLILVNTIENPDEIDETRAKIAAEKAKEALLSRQSRQDYILAQAKMARAVNRLKVKKKMRR